MMESNWKITHYRWQRQNHDASKIYRDFELLEEDDRMSPTVRILATKGKAILENGSTHTLRDTMWAIQDIFVKIREADHSGYYEPNGYMLFQLFKWSWNFGVS
jgi:hypothetical protein